MKKADVLHFDDLLGGQPYATPSVKLVKVSTRRRIMTVSKGNLDEEMYGGWGYAGSDSTEDDGGSLF